jgi:hypothetical protein
MADLGGTEGGRLICIIEI